MKVKTSGRKCQVTGKRSLVGNNVSHANNKTKTVSRPNLQVHRFWVPSQKKWVRLKVSTHAMRIIAKRGIDRVVADLQAAGQL